MITVIKLSYCNIFQFLRFNLRQRCAFGLISLKDKKHCSHRLCLQYAHDSRLFTVTTRLPHNIINIELASNAIV